MAKPIFVLNGPNLNRLGTREPHIYGTTTLADVEALCRAEAKDAPIEFRQTNSETQLIEWVHEAIDNGSGIIINPAAYTFTSLALFDALKMFPGPISQLPPDFERSQARGLLSQFLCVESRHRHHHRPRRQGLSGGGSRDARSRSASPASVAR